MLGERRVKNQFVEMQDENISKYVMWQFKIAW